MPLLKILTNIPRQAIPDDFLREASITFQAAIGKPMQYISVCVIPDSLMSFGGTAEPCASMHISSIGKLGVEENKALSTIMFAFIKDKLNIPGTRAYLTFQDEKPSEVSYNGTTFAK